MAGVVSRTDVLGPQRAGPPRDAAIAALAVAQHGVVSLTQLVDLGLGARGVSHRVRRGALHRVHRGVFAVGHPLLGREGRFMAAVLACGPGAALSHRSAAALWGLRPSSRLAIEVSTPHGAGRRRDGIDAHSGATLAARDVATVAAIACTSVARTLLDLADAVDRRGLERALERAEILRLVDMRELADVLDRANGRRGAGTLRGVLATTRAGRTLTRSALEERFLAICREASLPRPEVSAWLAEHDVEADFLWRDAGLIVETDGRATHHTAQAFERDRRRDQRLAVAGWRVIRFTHRRVTEERAGVASTLAALLSGAGESPPARRAP